MSVRLAGDPPTHLELEALRQLGLRHAVTTRHHGNFGTAGAPGGPFAAASGGPALRALGIDGATVRFVRQVHGVTTAVADDRSPALVGTADALATGTPGVPLAIFTADCLPVIVTAPARGVLAIVHAGWRGTVAGILGRLVAELRQRFGVGPAELTAAIGPSIGPCCYEVDEPVIGPLRRAFAAEWARWATPGRPGRWQLDLWQASGDQLVTAGLAPEAVVNPRLCTGCRGDLFYSYRREGGGLRLATIAVLDQVD